MSSRVRLSQNRPYDPLQLLRLVQVAELLSIKRSTLRSWISQGKFPPPDARPSETMKLWRRSTVEAWIAAGGKLQPEEP
jgi:predicted DNA-binding transcriptional regulator AlpA